MNVKKYSSLPWPVLLGAKFVQINTVGTVLAAILALFGQIAVLGAFILPLKIVMLMGGDGFPDFFPDFLGGFNKKIVVSALAGLSIFSYIFYQLSAKAIEKISQSGVVRIEKKTQKLYLFEGQKELTQKSYAKYINAVASVSFIVLATALLFFVYSEIAVVFTSYGVLCIVGALFFLNSNMISYEKGVACIQKKIPTLSGVGFFLIFLWILFDYIFLSIPNNFLVLLVAIILGRQLLSQTGIAVNSLIFLNNNKIKLKAILLHEEVLQSSEQKTDSFWGFLEPGSSPNRQLQALLMNISSAFENGLVLEWRDSALPGIAFLNATNGHDGKTYLVKIFAKNKITEARHEAALLLEQPELLPSPELLATNVIFEHHLHIFDLTGYTACSRVPSRSEQDEIVMSIGNTKLGDLLISRYTRSHQMLWDRLDASLLKKIALTAPDRGVVETFMSKLSSIKDTLRCQPICLYNPQVNNSLLWAKKNGSVVLLHWGKWSLEPYGAGLSLNYGKSVSENYVHSEELEIKPRSKEEREGVLLSAIMYKIWKQLKANQFNKAAETIDKV
ncbi:hypothetical protein [Chromohalobacter sp. HP20-39]|uniref:hypothetical protein n=1 Tax=Chromohalobacter sp. HP20-39 TaxID=3079306 RepID=UPI00294B2513|nr:hypothetical protein [Chromohalobacter sp. HP20-39]MDV6320549.1 hypothetical protein [Chromohalobacter sp. HP20-39]